MLPILITSELNLALALPEHAEQIFKQVNENRQTLREWLPWIDQTLSVIDSQKFIASAQKQFMENNGFQAIIWYRRQIVGNIGLHSVDHNNRKTSLGYWLSPPFQGRGLATLSAGAICRYVFTHMGLNRIEIRCATENKKSRAIPERLGFRPEGILRQNEWVNDHFVDHAVYGLLLQEWQKPPPGP
jgi:ribosomal-protein-serine acetyltransferase